MGSGISSMVSFRAWWVSTGWPERESRAGNGCSVEGELGCDKFLLGGRGLVGAAGRVGFWLEGGWWGWRDEGGVVVGGVGAEAHFVVAEGAGCLAVVAVSGKIIRRIEVRDGEEESWGDAAERGKNVAIGEIDRATVGECVEEDAGDGGVFLEVVAAGKVGGGIGRLVGPGDDGNQREVAQGRKIFAVGEALCREGGRLAGGRAKAPGAGGVWARGGVGHGREFCYEKTID